MRKPSRTLAGLTVLAVTMALALAPVPAAAVGDEGGTPPVAAVDPLTIEGSDIPAEGVGPETAEEAGEEGEAGADAVDQLVPSTGGQGLEEADVPAADEAPEGSDAPAADDAPEDPGAAEDPDAPAADDAPALSYAAHVSYVGWMAPVTDGMQAGTTGQARSIEALDLALAWPGHEGAVEASAHVQDIGWMDWASGVVGTTGQGRRMEAVCLRLTGELADRYDVWYRVHAANVGWLGWASNGETAGTTGLNWGIEAIEIRLVEKGSAAPVETSPHGAYVTTPALSGQAHVSYVGWMQPSGAGAVLGTTGRGLAMEAYRLSVSSGMSGGITYSAHVSEIGWTVDSANGEGSGTTGRGLAMEAVKIRLTGTLASFYDVWYRAHVENYGWLGWTSNGSAAGTSGIAYRLEALQVVLLPKGSAAPGSTARPYATTPVLPADQAAMLNRANGYASATSWLILVDTTNCRIGIYNGSRGAWRQVANWVCSTGQPWTPTVIGKFTVTGKGYSFGHGYTCYYYTQFYGDYLIHSIKYYQGTFTVMDGRLGQHVSQGCVRLPIDQAKWIYDNIPYGTTVVTYR